MAEYSRNRLKSVTVKHGKDEAKVQIGSLQFVEFDDWVRRRFSVPGADVVIYTDPMGQEIIPGDVHDRIVVSIKPSAKAAASSDVFERIVTSDAWDAIVSFIPTLLIVLLAAVLMPQWQYASDYLLTVQKSLPLKKMTGAWLEKSYVGFLSWSVTYLFLRRALNPETTTSAVKKYSADAIFGGLAAAGAVIIKAAVLK